ncbi:MAG: hypothetical protein LH470_01445 [Lysobacter sp.]|nr:hypothetical protein [Lysobacter sp.]
MSKQWLPLAVLLLLAACQSKTPDAAVAATVDIETATSAQEGGAISAAPVAAPPVQTDIDGGTKWPPAKLTSGEAVIRCDADGTEKDAGIPLVDLEFFSVVDAVSGCQSKGVLRLNYSGEIGADFTALMDRVANVANRMGIRQRILDIDSSGGRIEDAMKAGDIIGESQWTLRIHKNAICHSACVLILAAGDMRMISGKIGIHRMVRIESAATSRAELSQELRDVHSQMKQYLERNGAAVAVADLMMTVPNRKLRLLSALELKEYGLDGTNAAQDDLERIKLTRRCGEDFVARKDDFVRTFDRQCARPGKALEAISACGLALRPKFDFPDEKCPADSPLAEYDDADGSGRGFD